MTRREDFVKRIAMALLNAELKRNRRVIPNTRAAFERADKIADQLPLLFTDEVIVIQE